MPYAVSRNLDEVLKECDQPTGQGRDVPGFGRKVFQVGVPGKSHEMLDAISSNTVWTTIGTGKTFRG